MQISNKKVVSVTYNLEANLPGNNKEHIETADASHPLTFLFGSGMMIPGFEKGLSGKSVGDKFTFSIAPEEAYGLTEKEAIVKLPIEIFKVDNVINFELLKIGNVLPLNDQQGNVMNGKILAYDDTTVTMDFNHPLAGFQLHFSGEVIEVREASVEEIEHNHVH